MAAAGAGDNPWTRLGNMLGPADMLGDEYQARLAE
jgi:hypothetical protein